MNDRWLIDEDTFPVVGYEWGWLSWRRCCLLYQVRTEKTSRHKENVKTKRYKTKSKIIIIPISMWHHLRLANPGTYFHVSNNVFFIHVSSWYSPQTRREHVLLDRVCHHVILFSPGKTLNLVQVVQNWASVLLHFYIWCNTILINRILFSPEGSGLVNISAGLSCVFTYAMVHSPIAVPSRTKLYAMLFDFFLRTESGIDAFVNTDLLSPKT